MVFCSREEFLEHEESYDGVCLNCNNWSCGKHETDACNDYCDYCGECKVFGAGQALIMGELDIRD